MVGSSDIDILTLVIYIVGLIIIPVASQWTEIKNKEYGWGFWIQYLRANDSIISCINEYEEKSQDFLFPQNLSLIRTALIYSSGFILTLLIISTSYFGSLIWLLSGSVILLVLELSINKMFWETLDDYNELNSRIKTISQLYKLIDNKIRDLDKVLFRLSHIKVFAHGLTISIFLVLIQTYSKFTFSFENIFILGITVFFLMLFYHSSSKMLLSHNRLLGDLLDAKYCSTFPMAYIVTESGAFYGQINNIFDNLGLKLKCGSESTVIPWNNIKNIKIDYLPSTIKPIDWKPGYI